jgi:hypothetical protein
VIWERSLSINDVRRVGMIRRELLVVVSEVVLKNFRGIIFVVVWSFDSMDCWVGWMDKVSVDDDGER